MVCSSFVDFLQDDVDAKILTHVPITLHSSGQEEQIQDICRYSLENIIAKEFVHPPNSRVCRCNLAIPQSTDIQDPRRKVAITKLLLLRSLIPSATNTTSIEVWLTWQLTQEQPNNNNYQLWSGLVNEHTNHLNV
uniref:Uncharacterized protein n=1 Tax=Glossina austeni TaxID=7395 RepID=A0A1A9VQ74_GLOAU